MSNKIKLKFGLILLAICMLIYFIICNINTLTWNDDIFAVVKAIRNGTPLPKGHGRLKDVDKLESHDEYDGQGFTKSVYKDDIDSLLTIIEPYKGSEE